MNDKSGIGFFEHYLTVWVILCIIVGIAIGQWLPILPETLGKWEYANVSIPIAVLIWLMIYPMMLKVDFKSVKNVGKKPKGIIITCVTNWLIKPFTMYGIAWLFFFVIFKTLIPAELADQYLAGAVLLGAAPCTAMVFVWSYLSKGDAAYTLVQVAVNDLIILVAYRFSTGNKWCDYSMGDTYFISCAVCRYSTCCRSDNKNYRSTPTRNRIL